MSQYINGMHFTPYRPGINLPLMRVSKTLANINALREAARIAIAKGLIIPPAEEPKEQVPAKPYRVDVMHKLKCNRCGNDFESRVSTAKLCSPLCRHRDYSDRQKGSRSQRLLKKQCKFCGGPFETFKKAANFCRPCRETPSSAAKIKRMYKDLAKCKPKMN